MANTSNSEMLQIIEAVAREKNIPRDEVIQTMEDAIKTAGHRKYGHDNQIKATINKKTGEITLKRVFTVVDKVENHFIEVSLKDAQKHDPDIQIGDNVYDPLPSLDLGRVAAQVAKGVIINQMLIKKKQRQFEELKDRKGEIITGVVSRIEFGNLIIDVSGAEGILKKEHIIKTESFRAGDRVKAYVYDVRPDTQGPLLYLSRTHEGMLAKLFELEIPEIYNRSIEIKGIARDPGFKAKIAVYSSDTSLDPVGLCVGPRGVRVQAITRELAGDLIDVILWSPDLGQFIINALKPAKITKIVIDENSNRAQVIVEKNQLSLAIGKSGQNVRLASKITGWPIDVISEEGESKRRSEQFKKTTEMFKNALDIEEVMAQLLCSEGFTTIDQIASSELNFLNNIEGFSPELSKELKDRATEYIDSKNQEIIERLEKLGVEQGLLDILYFDAEDILLLAENGIKTIEDLAATKKNEIKSILSHLNLPDSEIQALLNTAIELDSQNNS